MYNFESRHRWLMRLWFTSCFCWKLMFRAQWFGILCPDSKTFMQIFSFPFFFKCDFVFCSWSISGFKLWWGCFALNGTTSVTVACLAKAQRHGNLENVHVHRTPYDIHEFTAVRRLFCRSLRVSPATSRWQTEAEWWEDGGGYSKWEICQRH